MFRTPDIVVSSNSNQIIWFSGLSDISHPFRVFDMSCTQSSPLNPLPINLIQVGLGLLCWSGVIVFHIQFGSGNLNQNIGNYY
jgi:hypothetical protein